MINRIIPDSKDTLWNDTLDISSLISLCAIEFVLAHEYAHVYLGHLDGGKTSNLFTNNSEMEADQLAIDMFLQENFYLGPSGKYDPTIPMDFRLAGIYYGINLIQLISLRKTNTTGGTMGYYKTARCANVYNYLNINYTNIDNSLARSIRNTFDFIYEECQINTIKNTSNNTLTVTKLSKGECVSISSEWLYHKMILDVDGGFKNGLQKNIDIYFNVDGGPPDGLFKFNVKEIDSFSCKLEGWYDTIRFYEGLTFDFNISKLAKINRIDVYNKINRGNVMAITIDKGYNNGMFIGKEIVLQTSSYPNGFKVFRANEVFDSISKLTGFEDTSLNLGALISIK